MAAIFSFLQLNYSKLTEKLKNCGVLLHCCLAFFVFLVSSAMSYPAWTRTSLIETDRPLCTIKNWDEVAMEDWEKLLLTSVDLPVDDEMSDVIVDVSSGSYDYSDGNFDEYQFECKLQSVGANFFTWYVAMLAVIYILPVFVIFSVFVCCKRNRKSNYWSLGTKWLLGNSLAFALTWLPSNLFKLAKIKGIDVGPHQCEVMQDVTFVFGYLSCLAIPLVILTYTTKLKENNKKCCNKKLQDEKVEEKLMYDKNNYNDTAVII